jgi:uncharacterized protein (TIGR03437 family)
MHPLRDYPLNGGRRDISVNEVIEAMGRRTPDHTVAQRRFRFAFILIAAQGTQPSAADLSKLDALRQQFESYFAKASSNNATADTSLKRSLELSLFPATGLVPDTTVSATLTVSSALASDLTIQLQAPGGNATVPASVRIPAGAASAGFSVTAVRPGVQEITATPADSSYETAVARVQVADAGLLRLAGVSGHNQIASGSEPLPEPIVVKLTDVNNLSYPGARIVASASTGGSVSPAGGVTDALGQAAFRWSPGGASETQLQLAVERYPSVSLVIRAGSGVPVASEVLNAASFEPGVAAGGLGMVKGANLAGGQTASASYPWPTTLAGVRVQLNGTALPVFYASDTQVNFYVPQGAGHGSSTITVITPSGAQATATVEVKTVQPAIFSGAVFRSGTTSSATTTPVRAGDFVEIYCTGLGPTQASGGYQQTILTPTVFIGAVPVRPVFSGLMPGAEGVYQLNVQVPAGVAAGQLPVVITVNTVRSNEVMIRVE